ncbi:MAG: mandelate racemase/muconate lactonizing enzyme family protein [Alphaproteobacteria bacterium]|nr:mandelate racemase/muconate lactonizing enzyme family protein [Alphaproteobacteria bacterium]MBU1561093.1 mandelate racemase/muconate lactonizing enzyme family protein [Alphaproteobacteria bacterium]MBU2303036.1 mandelate racemase/muconate lactonizing enzyme family protein [Alphaproteobacteria bacterium]MBU2368362.1 mandelate racemase/muconate lactonizing enzyme family protein [Alphaproteobacteria bacterium]
MSSIANVEAYILKAEVPEPFYFAQPGYVTHRSSMVVEIVLDDGRIGYGEALCNGHQPADIAAATVTASLKPLLIGRDPLQTSVLYEEMYNLTKPFGQKGGVIGGISAVDIALWDLKGQILDLPIHALLGGAFRTSILPYATGFYRVKDGDYPRLLVEEAQRHVRNGFSAFKVKIGFGIDDDIRNIAAVREAVGSGVRIMADCNHAYNAGAARRLVRELDRLGVYWLEEPITPEDVDGYRSLVEMAPSLLIAAGENEFSRHGFWPWVKSRALDVLQPDLAAGGGFTGLREIQTLALSAGLAINPHVWGTAIGLAAAIQFIACIPPVPISRGGHEPMLEYDQSAHPFRRDLIAEQFAIVDGRVSVPDRPGLGITVNRDALLKYRY